MSYLLHVNATDVDIAKTLLGMFLGFSPLSRLAMDVGVVSPHVRISSTLSTLNTQTPSPPCSSSAEGKVTIAPSLVSYLDDLVVTRSCITVSFVPASNPM